jgi:anthraniloyl-CoA monooxygenase
VSSRKVEVIGGGPAGLYAARLIKLADPQTEVVVHERSKGSAETFGFGVGLTESTMKNLAEADRVTADRIREASYAGHTLDFRSRDSSLSLHGARNLAIGRATLLGILTEAAIGAGVDYRPGSIADPTTVDADIVIAADGVRSVVRQQLAADLGVHTSLGRSRFVWCGTDFAVDSAFFTAVTTDRGTFIVHAYPYAEDRSTFLIEVDEETWKSAGLDRLDATVAAGETDDASVSLLEEVFAKELLGRSLLTNRTRWGRFTTLTLDRWSAGNVVLLGDAAHTAHYTLGSGTKLALEDAIALADSVAGSSTVPDAFADYEQRRRPPVERFRRLAGRSQRWWDSYALRSSRPMEEIALSYMTRAGNLGIADYAADQPDAVRKALAPLGATPPADRERLDDWVLSRPVDLNGLTFEHRDLQASDLRDIAIEQIAWTEPDVWNETADIEIERLRSGDDLVLLTGPDDDGSVGARIDMAERTRLETTRPVVVALPERVRFHGAAGIAASRCDAVLTT